MCSLSLWVNKTKSVCMMLFWGFWPLSACLHAAGGTSRHNGAEIAAPVRPTPAYLSNKMARRCRISAGRRSSDVYKIYRCGVWSRYRATVEKYLAIANVWREVNLPKLNDRMRRVLWNSVCSSRAASPLPVTVWLQSLVVFWMVETFKFVQEKLSNTALYPTVVVLSRCKVLQVGQL